MKVALYARVSSEKQDTDLSISAQLRSLREYEAKKGTGVTIICDGWCPFNYMKEGAQLKARKDNPCWGFKFWGKGERNNEVQIFPQRFMF